MDNLRVFLQRPNIANFYFDWNLTRSMVRRLLGREFHLTENWQPRPNDPYSIVWSPGGGDHIFEDYDALDHDDGTAGDDDEQPYPSAPPLPSLYLPHGGD